MSDYYEGLDPFDVCMSAIALGLVSDISNEDLWVACNLAESATEFDVAISASCELKDLVHKHYRKGR